MGDRLWSAIANLGVVMAKTQLDVQEKVDDSEVVLIKIKEGGEADYVCSI